jgi:hypothetical protein
MKAIVMFLIIVIFPFSYLLGQDEVEGEVIQMHSLSCIGGKEILKVPCL